MLLEAVEKLGRQAKHHKQGMLVRGVDVGCSLERIT